MLYYIKNHRNLRKIGYTDDIYKRMIAYKSHGGDVELIGTCEGSQFLEKKLHKLLKYRGHHAYFEWFNYSLFMDRLWDIVVNKKWKPIIKSGLDRHLYTQKEIWQAYDKVGKTDKDSPDGYALKMQIVMKEIREQVRKERTNIY